MPILNLIMPDTTENEDGCYAYGMFGFIAGFFLGLFGLLFMLCECTGIEGRRKKYFLSGWGVSFVLEIVIIVIIIVVVLTTGDGTS